jgi:polyisoprenoid-binding protein YceI
MLFSRSISTFASSAFALALCAVSLASALPVRAASDTTWTADPGHSSAEFSVKHLVITTVKGTIPIVSATVTTAAGSLVPESIDATLDPKNIDSKNDSRDNDLRGKNWLDVATYPTLTFASKKVVSGEKGSFVATGDLTIHGVTKSVDLAGTVDGSVTDGRGRTRVAYSATTTIDRRDFGLNFLGATPGGDAIVGNNVTISLEIEALAKAP